ncbi:nuclear exosome regulator NRDE2 [Osmerus eperlanus]|uniref:nuclear exosome regulator NRDE2 n=1 Tax=Osmerus eperlanus TaxID=29151 RepID=UPI002E0E3247
MALFPAFAGLASTKVDEPHKELEWLTNQSFRSDEALSLHQRAVEKSIQREQPAADTRLLSSEEEEEDRNDVSSKKRKKKEKKKKEKKKHRRKRRPSDSSGSDSDTVYPSDLLKKDAEEPSQQPQVQCQLEGKFAWLDDLQSPPAQLFCLDRKADSANWQYKSLYRGDIARYRRKGQSCLGLDPRRQAISWAESESSNRKRSDKNRKQTERYFCSSARPLLKAPSVPSLPGAPAPGPTLEYIPLPLCPKEGGAGAGSGPVSWVNPLGVYDDSTSLWLQGRGHSEQGQGQEPSRDKDSSAALLAGRVEDFNRRLRETPTDTQLWLQFLHFQDELWDAGGFGGEGGSREAERGGRSVRASVEKKMSIAERALESNPGCVALQLERLRLSRELCEPAALQKEWRKLVFLHPNSAPIWREYLLFTQSHFSTFSVSKVNSAYGKCLSTLAAVQDGSMTSHPALPGTQESMLDIFVQQCHFLRQAGHSEKAACLFQALLDFTFFKPDSVKDLPTRQQVEFFEPFWDSGEARVGERGARGWKAWMLQQERGGWLLPNTDDDDDDDEDPEEELKDRTWPKGRIWLDIETSREANHWLPWRPDKAKGQSVEDCEDPDRQVLFDDIGQSLIRVNSPELKLRLMFHFLQFLGLPTGALDCSSAHTAPWWSSLLEDLSLLGEVPQAQPPLTAYHLPAPLVSPVGHMTTLQGARKWADLGKPGEEFLTNVFQMLLPLFPSKQRAVLYLCWLQYEKLKVLRCVRHGNKRRLRVQGKRSKRVAKCLLKEPENRGWLPLWREYAHLEWLLGNLADARKVFDSALVLGVAGGLADSSLCHLCLLYAQLEVEEAAGQSVAGGGQVGPATGSAAVYVLTKLAEGGSYAAFSGELAPVAVLKARRTYELALHTCLAGLEKQEDPGKELNAQGQKLGGLGQWNQPSLVSGLVGCYALFQYLTVGVEAAQAVYSLARERLGQLHSRPDANSDANLANANTDPSPASVASANRLASECEYLAVQQAALLHYHTSTSVYPLRPLRETLTSALQLHPTSAPLWRLYVQVENRYHSAGRARRFCHGIARGCASVVPRLFAISAEQHRKQLLDSAIRSCSQGEALPTLPENGLSNRIRSLFENALATEQGTHCPLLWRMNMHFLVSDGSVEKGRAVFYKALQDVPWAKGVYMDAVRLFPEHMQEYLDLLTEKELRLRLPMEEMDILLED